MGKFYGIRTHTLGPKRKVTPHTWPAQVAIHKRRLQRGNVSEQPQVADRDGSDWVNNDDYDPVSDPRFGSPPRRTNREKREAKSRNWASIYSSLATAFNGKGIALCDSADCAKQSRNVFLVNMEGNGMDHDPSSLGVLNNGLLDTDFHDVEWCSCSDLSTALAVRGYFPSCGWSIPWFMYGSEYR